MYIIEIVNIILSTPSSYIFPLHIGLIRHVDKITALLFYFTIIRARVYTCIFKMPVNTDSCNLICKLLIDRSLRCCLNIYQSYMRLTEDFLWRKKNLMTRSILLCSLFYIYIAAFYVFLGEIKQSFQNLTMALVKFVDKVLKIDIKSIGTECVFSLLLHVIQHYNALVSVNCLL